MATYQAGGKFNGRSSYGNKPAGQSFQKQGGAPKEKKYFASHTIKVKKANGPEDAKPEKVLNLISKLDGSTKAPSIFIDEDTKKALMSLEVGDQLVMFLNEPKKD